MTWHRVRLSVLFVGMTMGAGGLAAQSVAGKGPVPGPVVAPPFFRNAVERRWRTEDGSPGPAMWTNWAHYDLAGRLDPATARLEGTATVHYYNRSPVPLRVLAIHLAQNLHKGGGGA